jgi:K+-sensing histidine kinase KdpD
VPETLPSMSSQQSRAPESPAQTPAPLGARRPSLLRSLATHVIRYALGLSVIALIMLIYVRGGAVNAATVGFVLLLAILCASTIWGLGVAVAMSVVATLGYDYFVIPPINTFNISDPRDWVALVSFIATAVIGRREDRQSPPARG